MWKEKEFFEIYWGGSHKKGDGSAHCQHPCLPGLLPLPTAESCHKIRQDFPKDAVPPCIPWNLCYNYGSP